MIVTEKIFREPESDNQPVGGVWRRSSAGDFCSGKRSEVKGIQEAVKQAMRWKEIDSQLSGDRTTQSNCYPPAL